MKLHVLMAAVALPALALVISGSANAQLAPTTPPADKTTAEGDQTQDTTGVRADRDARTEADAGNKDVVVTGSRLARPGVTSIAPITSVTANELLSQGNLNVGDALNDLPQLRSTYSQASSTRFIGTSGVNFLDLRGLGISRTLVLVNGRRHVGSLPGSEVVDTNTIPSDLLERVDVLTGGESAVYGSDAIAGVVNFVLKQDFDGLKINGQGGATNYKDRGSEYLSAVWGKNYAGGRGNLAVAAEYTHSDAVYYRDRDFETGADSGRNQFNLQENVVPEGTMPFASDGIIDNGFYHGVRNGNISNGGILNAVCNSTTLLANAARCRQGSNYLQFYPSPTTAALGQRYAFVQGGNLVLSNPSLDFRDITANGSSNTVGGLGSTLYETGQLAPRLDRISLNAIGHFDISDALTIYGETKYVKVTANQEGQPTFFQGLSFRCTNPFVNAQALSTLQSIGYCGNLGTTPASTATFATSRFNVDFGGRAEIDRRETIRFVAGVRGNFLDTWKYDVSATYGEYRSKLYSQNNQITANFNNAINAVLAPATFTGSNYILNAAGQKVICAVNATANAVPGCYPLNTFGYGSPDPASLAYINTTTQRVGFTNQLDVNGYVSGDFGKLFMLPGGPIAFVLGGEYRRENSYQVYDPLVSSGQTFLNAIQPFYPPTLSIKEGFAELSIPLLKDRKFFQNLEIKGAARVSSYNTSAGTTWSYNGGAVWAPFDFIQLRGNYARAVRTPTQGDLYSTPSQNFAQVQDPCDVLYIGNGPNRAANCRAAGVPTNFINTLARSQTTGYLSGGNPNLTAETADSFTFGGVIQPKRFIPGLTFTVDYYNITVKNLIASLAPQTILNSCYDSSTGINNQFCQLVFRNPDSSFATYAVLSAGVNFAKQKTSGIDLNADYNHAFDANNKLGVSINATWVAQRDNYINPQDPNYASRQLSNLGDPKWEVQATFSFTHGPFNLQYGLHFLDKMTIAAYEAQHYFDGRPPTNLDVLDPVWYPVITYHKLRLATNVDKRFQFYIGVDNLTNKLPPYGLFGNGANDAIYDPYGRTFYAGFHVTL